MYANSLEKFRAVNDFPELVEYLGDELEWPIDTSDFEEMTFEYSAEELGLDQKTAPKFLEIRRLRPLDKDQPWGIFFIRFDNNTLPVVALRRLLSKLVLKKRGLASAGDRASWHENDLLLISQTGKEGAKSISFAHFASNPEKTDLPILKVLGWDDDDTGLKLDYVIETLRTKLKWPEDPTDSEAWRNQWRDAFTLKNREVIQNSKEMAERLGQLALAVRTRLREVLAVESDEGPIHKLMSIFKENLISDLDTDSFSDMYAQTIAYGLLSARIINPKANTADAAHSQVPITNPFLRELMETFLNLGGRSHRSGIGLDFDELGINEVVDLLDNTNMEAVLRDFGDRNQKEDPVMHFFEGFLQEYDSKIRKDRGVFYTPQPVVAFIVRSVDEQLRTEFGIEDGLADVTTWGELAERTADLEIPTGTSPDQAFVQILDPATGTGTFPVEVINLIHKTMTAKWKKQGNREAQIKELWNNYVPKHLLPRIHGYELMMAPYAIAHMKIGLKLYETGYRFESNERAHIFLTNALEPAQDDSGSFKFAIPALAREGAAVTKIKRDQRFTVVIGNPPYSSSSQNNGGWIMNLIADYKKTVRIEETQIQALSDDYVKFLRLAQSYIEISGRGVIGFITNNNFLSGTTFRDMRQSLINSFNSIQLTDLHGNGRIREKAPGGGIDENVFDILTGVAVSIFSRSKLSNPVCNKRDIFGPRATKYSRLLGDVAPDKEFYSILPESPQFEFRASNQVLSREYGNMKYLPEVFGTGVYQNDKTLFYGSGFKTQQDEFAIGFSQKEIVEKVSFFLDETTTEPALRERFTMCGTNQWNYSRAKRDLKAINWQELITPCLYRPFDTRFTVLHGGVVSNPRMKIMGQFLVDNLGLCVGRQGQVVPGEWSVVFCTCWPQDQNLFYRGGNTNFPLYLGDFGSPLNFESRQHNLSKEFLKNLGTSISLETNSGTGLPAGVLPEDVLGYIYAVLHCPSYRSRYAEFLKVDFPRIPLPKSASLFWALTSLGASLVNLHLMRFQLSDGDVIARVGLGELRVEKVTYSKETVWIDRAQTKGFKNISEEIWKFKIGGYQVCEKWLKDRGPKKGNFGQTLTEGDIEHYQKIIIAVRKNLRIVGDIDDVIEAYGSWPGAFVDNGEQ